MAAALSGVRESGEGELRPQRVTSGKLTSSSRGLCKHGAMIAEAHANMLHIQGYTDWEACHTLDGEDGKKKYSVVQHIKQSREQASVSKHSMRRNVVR